MVSLDITDELQLELEAPRGLSRVSTSQVESKTQAELLIRRSFRLWERERRRLLRSVCAREHVRALENELIRPLQLQTDAGIFTQDETLPVSLGTERSNISLNSPQVP